MRKLFNSIKNLVKLTSRTLQRNPAGLRKLARRGINSFKVWLTQLQDHGLLQKLRQAKNSRPIKLIVKYSPSPNIIVGLFVVFMGLYAQSTSNPTIRTMIDRIDHVLYDIRYQLLLPEQKPDEHKIIIIDIDEKSLEAEGRWPWSRRKIGELVEALNVFNVGVIAFDVSFSEPERNLVRELRNEFSKNDADIPTKLLDRLDPWEKRLDSDIIFAKHISQAPVVLGLLLQPNSDIRVGNLPNPAFTIADELIPAIDAFELNGYTANLNLLQNAARSNGYINVIPDQDGVIRRVPLFIKSNNQMMGSLNIEALRVFGEENITPRLSWLNETLVFEGVSIGNNRFVPTNEHGQVLVPYRGPAFTYPYISATDVLRGETDLSQLEDAIALIGTSALGLADLRTVPMQVAYPGVEVHANVLSGLLNPDLFHRELVGSELALFLLLMLISGLILVILMRRLSSFFLIAASLAATVLATAFNFVAWSSFQYDLPLAAPMMIVIAMAIYNISIAYISERSQRQMIRGIFNQYVSPDHIDEMVNSEEGLSLEGERREMTVLFSDIRSFTNISETLSAEELKNWLNRYFTPVTRIIFENQGTVDKYVGDMVMAFWGAPLKDQKHAANAVGASLLMLDMTTQLRQTFEQENLPSVQVGIGINTGMMNVGDMGSEYRRAYTVLGDAVNLGSRLEALTKFYGVNTLISENTYQQCSDDFVFRPIDRVIVKGKTQAVAIYEPLGRSSDIDAELEAELEEHNAAYALYLERDWRMADKAFSALLQKNSSSAVCKIYLERINEFMIEEPADDWEGEFVHTSK